MLEPEYTKAFREANYRQLQQYICDQLAQASTKREQRILGCEDAAQTLSRLRGELLADIGYPPPFAREQPGIIGQTLLAEQEGLQFYRLSLHITKGLDCYGILIKPACAQPLPLCVLLHGAGGCPEMITGLHMTANYYDAGKVLAKQGWIVYAPLLTFRSFLDGEQSAIPEDARVRMDRLLQSMDTTLAAVEMLKIRTATDLLLRRPDVRDGSVGLAGLSFGGFYTLLCAAADKRFDPIYASCFFADQITLLSGATDMNLAEFVWRGSANRCSCAELAMLCAPRRLILESGVGDALFPIDNVRAEARKVKTLFEKMGCADQFHFVQCSGQHEFGLDEALRYFRWTPA